MNVLSHKNRSILREMIASDFKIRYQGSLLGYTWSVLRPLFLFAILYIVFIKFLRLGNNIPHAPIYLLLGIVLWSFFTESTGMAMTSIVSRADLIKKIRIPRYLVVVSAVSSAFINLGLNMVVLGVLAYLNGVRPMESWVMFPLLLVELLILSTALGFFLSALFVKYRDASYIWEVLLQAGFYATPILYPLSYIPQKFQPLLMINPVAQIIQDSRWSLISHDPIVVNSWTALQGKLIAIPFIIITLIVVGSIVYFKNESKYFAENI